MQPILAICCCLLPATALAIRADASNRLKGGQYSDASARRDGFPHLEIVESSNMWQTMRMLEDWETGRDFGLFLSTSPTNESAFYPRRLSRIAISRENRVLIINLRPLFAQIPQPLPAAVSKFLEDKGRVFYGLGILEGMARLAFEYDCVIQGVDFNQRRWADLRTRGGIYGLANRYLHMNVQRPPTSGNRVAQARRVWLHWAVADHFVKKDGMAHPDWMITMAEMYGTGPVHLRIPAPRHDWTTARTEWLELLRQRGEEERRRQEAPGFPPQYTGFGVPLSADERRRPLRQVEAPEVVALPSEVDAMHFPPLSAATG